MKHGCAFEAPRHLTSPAGRRRCTEAARASRYAIGVSALVKASRKRDKQYEAA